MCPLCSSNQTKFLYQPKNSKVDLKINICTRCSFVFSTYNELKIDNNTSKSKFSHLSCEADYSDIRVGKQQMIHYFKSLAPLIFKKDIKHVLDFRSARGDFIDYALSYFNLDEIDCIEEDSYMTELYDNNEKVKIHRGKYHTAFPGKKYDLIYCCHSLEHYKQPNKVLKFLSSKLDEGGVLYIDVPNLLFLNNEVNLDEYFYDKHLSYFSSVSLSAALKNNNLNPEVIDNDDFSNGKNLAIISYKSSSVGSPIYDNDYSKYESLILEYEKNLNKNRDKLSKSKSLINQIFSPEKINGVVGCGKMLDAFLKYGDLDVNNFSYFFDDFIIKCSSSVFNKKLSVSDDLFEKQMDNLLVLIKEPPKLLKNKINKLKSRTKVYYFEEFV